MVPDWHYQIQATSEGWQRIVTERVTAIVNLLRQRGIQVYWVGLPKMREPQVKRSTW